MKGNSETGAWFYVDVNGPAHRINRSTPAGLRLACGATVAVATGAGGVPDARCRDCETPILERV